MDTRPDVSYMHTLRVKVSVCDPYQTRRVQLLEPSQNGHGQAWSKLCFFCPDHNIYIYFFLSPDQEANVHIIREYVYIREYKHAV